MNYLNNLIICWIIPPLIWTDMDEDKKDLH
jgi:hypothetical protein